MGLRAASEYGFINARIRALKSRLLTVADYERLLQSADYEDFFRNLEATYYGELLKEEAHGLTLYPEELALLLARDFGKTVERLTKTLTGRVRRFTSAYLQVFLADGVKTVIRGVHTGVDRDEILRFTVPLSDEQSNMFNVLADNTSVQDVIEQLPFWDLRVALLTYLPRYEELGSTAPLEVAVEEWYLNGVLDALRAFPTTDWRKVLSVLETRVDLRNVLVVFRALVMGWKASAIAASLVRFTPRSRALVEAIKGSVSWSDLLDRLRKTRYQYLAGRLARMYEESKSLVDLELAVEDYIAKRVRMQMGAYPFHLGVVLAFFYLKFYEVRNIRTISVGIERGESADSIRRMITI